MHEIIVLACFIGIIAAPMIIATQVSRNIREEGRY
jgi:hypothetical protein